jgi:sugar lactone lactonase YvrE
MRHRYTGMLAALLAIFAAAISPFALRAQAQAAVTVAIDLDPNGATGIRIEGLVSDSTGRLYTSDLDSRRLFRFTPSANSLEILGILPRTASGMAFDSAGNLYMASGTSVLRVAANVLAGTSITSTDVVTFATGVTGANGLAFDGSGRLFVSGGASGNIYVVASDGVTSTFASGLTSERAAQQISTNGLAFWTDGALYSSNTGTGSIDRITLKADGTVDQVQQWVKDPLLLGADGITFAANGDLYVAANERNAIVRVTPAGAVSDVASNGNSGPLEFPASPAFSGNALFASNFDIERGANAPNGPGVGASIARIDVGVSGLPLPVTGAQPVESVTPASGTPETTTTPAATGTTTSTTPVATAVVSTPVSTAVASTPTTAPAVATSTTVPVVPTVQVPTVAVATPAPTLQSPGMPSTGAGDGSWPMALLMVVGMCGIAVLVGFILRSAEHTKR